MVSRITRATILLNTLFSKDQSKNTPFASKYKYKNALISMWFKYAAWREVSNIIMYLAWESLATQLFVELCVQAISKENI